MDYEKDFSGDLSSYLSCGGRSCTIDRTFHLVFNLTT